MTIRKRGDSFQADIMLGGTRHRHTFTTIAEAYEWEERAKLAHKLGQTIAAPRNVQASTAGKLTTLKGLLEHVERTHWRGTRGEKTASTNARQVVAILGPARHPGDISSADLSELAAELEDRGNSNATINRKLAALGKMLAIAHDAGAITRMPKLPKKREGIGRTRFLSVDEEARLLDLLAAWDQHRIRAFVIVAVDTGCRLGELERLRWEHCMADLSAIHVWETKADLPRTIPLTKRAQEALGSLRSGSEDIAGPFMPLNRDGALRTVLGRAFALLDLKDVTIHTLRHTCASRLASSPGVTIQYVQRWLGHKQVTTTMRYAHLAVHTLDHCRSALENAVVTTAVTNTVASK